VNFSKGSILQKTLPHREKKVPKKSIMKAVVASKNFNFVLTVALGFVVQYVPK